VKYLWRALSSQATPAATPKAIDVRAASACFVSIACRSEAETLALAECSGLNAARK
jgi:hypothetical protein